MGEGNEDQKQFFKDLGATAEQTVQEVRGFEESYYNFIQWAILGIPWLLDFTKKLHTYTEENFTAAYSFARDVSEAKDVQDFGRIQAAYTQKCARSFAAQVQDLAETYKRMALGMIKAPPISSR
jgi:Phasin protein